jgi:uridine kinase
MREQALKTLADGIAAVERPHPVRVAIDGVDASGKTTLADELAELLRGRGRHVIRASVDGFLRPRAERYRRGELSAEGYYRDSFDYEALVDELLAQLGPGGVLRYRMAIFDADAEVFVYEPLRSAPADAILLLDGVFLMRRELVAHLDFRVYVHADFEETLRRAMARDLPWLGLEDVIRRRYETRYIPGQRLYLEEARPHDRADIVLDNNDVDAPFVVKGTNSP